MPVREDEEHVASPSLHVVAQGRAVAGMGGGSAPASVCLALTPSADVVVGDVVPKLEAAPLPPAACCQRANRGRRSMLLAMEARTVVKKIWGFFCKKSREELEPNGIVIWR